MAKDIRNSDFQSRDAALAISHLNSAMICPQPDSHEAPKPVSSARTRIFKLTAQELTQPEDIGSEVLR